MSYAFTINTEEKILYETFVGDIDLETLDYVNQLLSEDNNIGKGFSFLTDLRQAHFTINYNEMFQHVLNLPVLGSNKQAILVSADHEFGYPGSMKPYLRIKNTITKSVYFVTWMKQYHG